MDKGHRFLVEIGTEELPPKSLKTLAQAFAQEVANGFQKLEFKTSDIQYFATPRRLAVMVAGLPARQPDRSVERKGPALRAAFDAHGNPTKAAQGFARSCGVEVDALEQLETPKGTWLVYQFIEPGKMLAEVIPGVIEAALTQLPIPRRMRWGQSDIEFVRPVHWVVLMIGSDPVKATILGKQAGRETRGHRFHHPTPIVLRDVSEYVEVLERQGRVLASFEHRQDVIRQKAEKCAQEIGAKAMLDAQLLDEVTALVEWPQAVLGSFDEQFLQIPHEVLIATMQDNQKYFPVVDKDNVLQPNFITVSNIESTEPHQVRAGNERVIRPRFSDAEFFWEQDRKQALATHLEPLGKVVFQEKLGSLLDKTRRLQVLAEELGKPLAQDPIQLRRAAELSKCDLLTNMVYEFPSLQGAMGRYYAQHDGEDMQVAIALDEVYQPRHAGDPIPASPVGRILALADRLDTLVGIFAAGIKPTGVKDPFGLRRAALGVLRILIEAQLDLDLEASLIHTANGFPATLNALKVTGEVFDYSMERLRAYYRDQGIPTDVVEAVLACRPTRPLDFDRRVRAVQEFRSLPEAESLAAANKRIRNILKQADISDDTRIDETLLDEEPECVLYAVLVSLDDDLDHLYAQGEYGQALTKLAALREPVDRFFDYVMVMVDDKTVRHNRISLLDRLSRQFLRTADLSRLQ